MAARITMSSGTGFDVSEAPETALDRVNRARLGIHSDDVYKADLVEFGSYYGLSLVALDPVDIVAVTAL